MTDTTSPTATDRLAGLLRKQEIERSDLAAQLLAEERRHAAGIVNDLRPDAGAALASAVDEVEAQIRQDHRAGRLLGRVATSLPEWMDSHFPALDPDDLDGGRRRVNVFIARPYADGHAGPVAWAPVDISDAIFGKGARRRRDHQLADDRVEEQARDREIQRQREREASRR